MTDFVATCGHYDVIGYINDAPCMKCVKKIHKEATLGRRDTLNKIESRVR